MVLVMSIKLSKKQADVIMELMERGYNFVRRLHNESNG